MDPDMNKYDLEHVTTGHPVMTAGEWQEVYRRAWDLYYSAEHIETIFRRAKASGIKPVRLLNHILQFYFTFLQENVHPLQGGYFRRQIAAASAAPACPAKPRSYSISDGSARSSQPTSKLAAFYLYLHRIAAASSATRDPTMTQHWRRSTANNWSPQFPVRDKAIAGAAA